jgi:hypothetical protein
VVTDVSKFSKPEQRARQTLLHLRQELSDWVRDYMDALEAQWGLRKAGGDGELITSNTYSCEYIFEHTGGDNFKLVGCSGSCGGCSCTDVIARRIIGPLP